MSYDPTVVVGWWVAVEPCDGDCGHPAHESRDVWEPMLHCVPADRVTPGGIRVPEGYVRPHPCGHFDPVTGCGGCDPSAVEFVLDDTTGRARQYDPARDLNLPK